MGHPGRRRLPRLRRKHLDRTAVMKRSRSRDDLSSCSGRHTEILRHGKTVRLPSRAEPKCGRVFVEPSVESHVTDLF
ncbi:hypothetical protein MTP99_005880 [Tenebrio molitor]|nr:hypothetical protein MTP99_005880 [Tenebrio molitor]